jgi:hypothetical protein
LACDANTCWFCTSRVVLQCEVNLRVVSWYKDGDTVWPGLRILFIPVCYYTVTRRYVH